MEIRKARQDKRGNYVYRYSALDGDEREETTTILEPGKDGVTVAWIKQLYSLQDSEVYYNLKNLRPASTKKEQETIKQWRENFIARFVKEHGYAPNKEDVDYFQQEVFQPNWNASLDFMPEDSRGSDNLHITAETAVEFMPENCAKEQLDEVAASMTALQRRVLQLKLDGYSLTEIAEIMGTSVPNIKKHWDKAIDHIKKNYYFSSRG